MKTCNKCHQTKIFGDFHKDATRSDGYRNLCKACVKNHSKAYYTDNKEKIVARVMEWTQKNRARHNEKCARWVKANRGKVNARTARRYASKTQATPSWVLSDQDLLWMLKEVYEFAKIREQMVGGKWEVDHILPLRGKTVMGLHVPWNLQVVPMHENRKKSNRFEVT